ncbi:HIT domain-containing protein [Longispora sp. K20-0274]|uniref:HIT family protein n=1 Tax=Longispora sp. K20-0274 TaxID=3088255 RepID=UPI003999B890
MTVTHEPPGYDCPFCRLAAGGGDALSGPADIVRRTAGALALISPRMWPNNRGHVLVVPTAHHENLYDLPATAGHAVHDLVREVAVAIRHSYGCAGVSTRQHNEPAGYQDVWHYHVHVFPRYPDDLLYGTPPLPDFATAEERRPYAERLRAHFDGERG